MAVPQNFRSAFNGFNREDVVNYLSYISAKHENQINALKSEAEELRQRLTEQVAALERVEELEQSVKAADDEREQLRSALREGESVWEQCQAELDGCVQERDRLQGELEAMKAGNLERASRDDQQAEALKEKDLALMEKDQLLEEKEREIAALKLELEQAKSAAQTRKTDGSGRWTEELNAYRRAESAERRARERVNQMYDQANGALAEASVRVERTAADVAELVIRVEAELALLRQAIGDSGNILADTAMALGAIRPETD